MSLWPNGRRKYIWAQHRFGKFVFRRSTSCASGGGEEESATGEKAPTKVIEVQVSLGTVPQPPRLDAYLSANTPEISRGRIVSSIKDGLVKVNGKSVRKPSHKITAGDLIHCKVHAPRPMEAYPEDIPLEIHYEDEHLMVVNKPAGLVVHPSAGHESGTLVNAVLFHCELPATRVMLGNERDTRPFQEEYDGDEQTMITTGSSGDHPGIVRPGIVHRLDKGTSGLMVVAKDGRTHAGLCVQFAARTVRRRYLAIVLGVPNPTVGRVNAPIGRDPRDRLKMGVVNGVGGRPAASNYSLRASLAGGNAALLEWQLETGRTHQIRVHTREIGHPILGDDTYGGSGGSAAETLHRRGVMKIEVAREIVKRCTRPMLHARTLGFQHPITGEQLDFAVDPPADFTWTFEKLQHK